MAKQAAKKSHIRWMIRDDMPAVVEIDRLCFFPNAWEWDDFIRTLRQRNCIGFILEEEGTIQGFVVYVLHQNHLEILRMAVHPDARRKGFGSMMVRKIAEKLSTHRRQWLDIGVRESNCSAQIFFKDCGFRAVAVEREAFDGEDAYRMEWRIGS